MRPARDYTGLRQTPSSLNFLFKERARVRGELDKRLKLIAELPVEICELMDRLAALDIVIPLHEVQVDPGKIEGKRPTLPRLFPKKGEFRRKVLRCLQDSKNPMYTSEIVRQVCHGAGISVGPSNKSRLGRLFRSCLLHLTKGGYVKRHHDFQPGLRDEGLWSLILLPEDES